MSGKACLGLRGLGRRKAIGETLDSEIRRSILGGEIAPGDPIFVDALAQRFAVSRVPIRDALRVLEGEGLVHSEPHHGYSVAVLSISELIELQAHRDTTVEALSGLILEDD